MYPASFEYHKPPSLERALDLLTSLGSGAKCIAGGHSLVPAMKLRLIQPDHLIDLSLVESLKGIRRESEEIVIGAMTTHWHVESSPIVRSMLPSLAIAASLIADPQVRNRGTIGGSLANADPAADYPANVLALGATMICKSATETRAVAAEDWFKSLLTTTLRSNEILAEVRIPLLAARCGAAYIKVPHPASRFAVVGVAAVVTLDQAERCAGIRIGITGIGEKAQRGYLAEVALRGRRCSGVRYWTQVWR